MAASDDYLEQQIDLLASKITTQNIPFSDTDHRKLVDIIGAMKLIKRKGEELETNLGVPLFPSIETYFGMVKNE